MQSLPTFDDCQVDIKSKIMTLFTKFRAFMSILFSVFYFIFQDFNIIVKLEKICWMQRSDAQRSGLVSECCRRVLLTSDLSMQLAPPISGPLNHLSFSPPTAKHRPSLSLSRAEL